MVSVCTGLLGKEGRVSALVDKTMNRIPLPLPLSYCLLCGENDGNMVVVMHLTFLSKKHKISSRRILLNSLLLEDDSGVYGLKIDLSLMLFLCTVKCP